MLGRTYRLPFTLLGIPILIDISFLVILPLMAWIIGAQAGDLAARYGLPHPEALTRGAMPYLLGLVAAVGLFICVVLHELGHAITARIYGVEVKHITLWALGGVAAFEDMPRQPGAEAVVGIAGPIVSVALGVLCWLAERAVPQSMPFLTFVLAYLALTNIVLAIFNMIPALPLDGGRVLRSLLALKLPYTRATDIAGGVSRALAIVLGLIGLISFNPFMMAVAFFIYMAVASETRLGHVEALLQGIPIRRLMSRDVKSVPPDMTLADLLQAMLRERHIGFPVVDPSTHALLGMVHLSNIEGRDAGATVSQVMARDVPTIRDSADALEAFKEMSRQNFNRLCVVDDAGAIVGIISKVDLMHVMRIRAVSERGTAPLNVRPAPQPYHPPPAPAPRQA